MASMTCQACNIAFEDVELGRQHYKTDWHRYNLKRRVANLVPITLEKFQERQEFQNKEEAQESNPRGPLFCKPCNKSFSSSNAYENHIVSKKHKDVIAGKNKKGKKKQKRSKPAVNESTGEAPKDVNESETVEAAMSEGEEDGSDVESWDSYDENTLGIEECLFCSHLSSSMENNISHMTSTHGFFLPDAEYISNLEGLITYLGEKVGAGHVCLWCNEKGKRFHSTKDVQRHMVDKGHCKLLHEGDAVFEFSDFYDYSLSYPDQDTTDANPDDVVDPSELESDGFSLTLPSGATIGHRSLVRYYNQNLVPYLHDQTKKVLPKMLAHYRALGWTGTSGVQVQQKVKDLQYMQRLRKNYYTKLGCKANNLRHRFRDPTGP